MSWKDPEVQRVARAAGHQAPLLWKSRGRLFGYCLGASGKETGSPHGVVRQGLKDDCHSAEPATGGTRGKLCADGRSEAPVGEGLAAARSRYHRRFHVTPSSYFEPGASLPLGLCAVLSALTSLVSPSSMLLLPTPAPP